MNVIDAKADVFWMAFKGLPKKEKQSVVERLLTDSEFMDDLIDIATLELRCEEPSRPLNTDFRQPFMFHHETYNFYIKT
ncbi:MAG TPA: hypothetical protein C5S51_09405 [Methanosarcinaceae archaeon]|nr:hypothetical protein [Methanosarcinaceae archaeon]